MSEIQGKHIFFSRDFDQRLLQKKSRLIFDKQKKERNFLRPFKSEVILSW